MIIIQDFIYKYGLFTFFIEFVILDSGFLQFYFPVQGYNYERSQGWDLARLRAGIPIQNTDKSQKRYWPPPD